MASYFSCSVGDEQQFRVALSNGGMNAELVRTVGNDAALGEIMVDALKAHLQATLGEADHSPITHILHFDRTASLESLIVAGRYDLVDHGITSEHFPEQAKEDEPIDTEEVEVILVHLPNTYKTPEQVDTELERRGLKPGDIRMQLALGAAHPKLQQQFPIVATGSSWRDERGSRLFPVLWKNDRGRTVGLRNGKPDIRRSVEDRFLAVRTSTAR